MERALPLLTVASVLAACADDGTIAAPDELQSGQATWNRVSLRIEGGNQQAGVVGTELSEILAVRAVRKSQDRPVSGLELGWEIVEGGGALEVLDARTDSDGLARARLTLGEEPGLNRVLVRTPSGSAKLFEATGIIPAATSVSASPEQTVLLVGDTARLSFEARDTFGNVMDPDPSWSSSDPTVALVDASGLVTGVGAGSAEILGTQDGRTASAAVTVEQPILDPGTVDDLRVVVTTESSVTLRWTDVDDGLGSPARYGVRIGSPEISWGQADDARYLHGEAVGTDVELTWDGLSADTRYQFQLVAFRVTEDGTAYSGLSNVATGITEGLPVVAVEASASSITLSAIEATASLSATVLDGAGQPVAGESVAWTSLDPTVATIAQDGTVTARAVGLTAAVVETGCCDLADTVQVSVEQVPAQVTVEPGSASLVVGENAGLSASVADANGHDVPGAELSWISSDASVAAVDGSGLISALAAGSAAITAASEDATGTAQVVVEAFGPATSLSVIPGSADLAQGDTLRVAAEANDAFGNPVGESPAWSTSNAAVASVTADGLVTALEPGSAIIRATLDGVSSESVVTVTATTSDPGTVQDLRVVGTGESSVTLRWTEVDDGTGSPARYAVRIGSPQLSWGSADDARYLQGNEVGADLELLWDGLAPGTSYEFQLVAYRRSDDGTTDYSALSNVAAAVTEQSAPRVGRVVASTATVLLTALGATEQLGATVLDGAGLELSGETLEWVSLDGSVASVAADGRVTALADGVADVVVRAACCAAADTVEVTVEQVPTAISVDPAEVMLSQGESRSLDATVTDANGYPVPSAQVSWQSSNPSVASVDASGRVAAMAAGTAWIEASTGPLAGTAAVQVEEEATEPPPEPSQADAWYEQRWDYRTTSEMFSDPEVDAQGAGATLVTGLPGLPWGGSNEVRADFPGGGSSYTAGVNLFPPRAGTDRPREMWVEVWVRFDENWRIAGDHKTIFLLEGDNPAGGNRWEIKVGLWGNTIRGQIQNGAEHEETACLPPVGPDVYCSPSDRPELESFFWDGEWHRLRWHVKMSSHETGGDGALEAWLDGVKFLESFGISTNSTPQSYFRYMALGRNGDPIDAASIHWGAVSIFTADPGW